eukprot:jgi/Hompol1/1244/HPOL_001760-RA
MTAMSSPSTTKQTQLSAEALAPACLISTNVCATSTAGTTELNSSNVLLPQPVELQMHDTIGLAMAPQDTNMDHLHRRTTAAESQTTAQQTRFVKHADSSDTFVEASQTQPGASVNLEDASTNSERTDAQFISRLTAAAVAIASEISSVDHDQDHSEIRVPTFPSQATAAATNQELVSQHSENIPGLPSSHRSVETKSARVTQHRNNAAVEPLVPYRIPPPLNKQMMTLRMGLAADMNRNNNSRDNNPHNSLPAKQGITHHQLLTGTPPPQSPQGPGRKAIGDWTLGKTIGEGASGKVKLAENTVTGERCVVKAVRRPKMSSGETVTEADLKVLGPEALSKIYKRELYMIREAALCILLDHPNIVRLHSAVLGENHFYCFFEYVEGEDLVDYIARYGRIKERKSRSIFRQVLSAIEYAHRNNVVHRDIKLENIRYNEDTGIAKLLDFGFATFHSEDHLLQTNCGSPCYAAPEIYDNRAYRGPEIDIWSLGVCLYGMVTGSLPFDGPNFRTLAAKVREGHLICPTFLSEQLRNLLMLMLRTVASQRITLAGILGHPWVNATFPTAPVDVLIDPKRSQDPAVPKDLVDRVLRASICDSGCLLMQVLKQRMPQRKLQIEEEWRHHAENAAGSSSGSPRDSLATRGSGDVQFHNSIQANRSGPSRVGSYGDGTTVAYEQDTDSSGADEDFDVSVRDKGHVWWKRLLNGFARKSQKPQPQLQPYSLEPTATITDQNSDERQHRLQIPSSHNRLGTSDGQNFFGGTAIKDLPNRVASVTAAAAAGTRPILTRLFHRRVTTASAGTYNGGHENTRCNVSSIVHGRAYTGADILVASAASDKKRRETLGRDSNSSIQDTVHAAMLLPQATSSISQHRMGWAHQIFGNRGTPQHQPNQANSWNGRPWFPFRFRRNGN